MIIPAAAMQIPRSSKRLFYEASSESDDVEFIADVMDTDCSMSEEDSNSEENNPVHEATNLLKSTWEESLIGKWYGVIYGDKKPLLYIAKVEKRFLLDEGGRASGKHFDALADA